LILVHLSTTPLDDNVNSGALRLNLNSLLWHQPIYHNLINLSVILAYRCILLLPFGNVNFCLIRYPRWRAAVNLFLQCKVVFEPTSPLPEIAHIICLCWLNILKIPNNFILFPDPTFWFDLTHPLFQIICILINHSYCHITN